MDSGAWGDVEAAWLAAGSAADVDRLRQLQAQHPRRLALNRIFHGDRRGRTSDWSGFPLATLGDSTIHAAVWNRSIEVLRFLLNGGQHPDARDGGLFTPLMVTIVRHGLPLIRSVFVGREAIPRHLAMDCREEVEQLTATTLTIMRLLVQFGADVNAHNNEGRTGLMIAAHDDALEVAELLLQEGAAIDVQDQQGWTALRHCVEGRSLFVTNLLLTHGANIDLPSFDGISPLQAAIRQQSFTVLQIFINHFAYSARPQRLDFVGFLLFEAVEADAQAVVDWLLQDGTFVTVQFRNEIGESVFHHACSSRMIELLLEYDKDWSAFRSRTLRGESCFHLAAQRPGNPGRSALESLLRALDQATQTGGDDAGRDISELLGADSNGSTPLFAAASHLSDLLETRVAKCEALMARNVPLFPPTEQLWRFLLNSSGRITGVVLSDRVQMCLSGWLIHCGTEGEGITDRDLAELLTHWIACVNYEHTERRDLQVAAISSEVVAIMMHIAFVRDLVPLLLALPLRASSVEEVLDGLHNLVARWQPDQALFLRHLVLQITVEFHRT